MPEEPTQRGTPAEQETYWEVKRHYDLSREDLETRYIDWNKKDELFRSHIDEEGWPYQAQVFDPRVFTAIFEKSARLLAKKPKGRLVPREGGDALGAKSNNSILERKVAALLSATFWSNTSALSISFLIPSGARHKRDPRCVFAL